MPVLLTGWLLLVIGSGWAEHPLANLLQTVATIAVAVLTAGRLWYRIAAGHRSGRVRGVVLVLSVFLVALGWAALQSASPGITLWGSADRLNGSLLYAACVVLLFATVMEVDERGARTVVTAWALCVQGAAAYGLVSWLGWSPWHESAPRSLGHVLYALFGNPDFAAAFLAIGLAPAVWLARTARRPASAFAWGGVAMICLAVILTETLQGLAVLLVVATGLTIGWGTERWPRLMAWAGMSSAIVALGTTALVLVMRPSGLLSTLSTQADLDARFADWTAAWRMTMAYPLNGVGPGLFDAYYGVYRSTAPMRRVGWQFWSDSAHNVPLQFFASGGIPLGLAYLAVVALTAVYLAAGLRRHSGTRRQLLVVCGAAWLGYQAQALVSIDEPQLVFVHWLVSGLIITLGAADNAPRYLLRRWPRSDRLARPAMVAALVVALVPVGLYAIEADGWSDPSRFSSPARTLVAAARTVSPWRDVRYLAAAEWHLEAGRMWHAAGSLERALEVMPRNRTATLGLARIQARMGRWDAAAAAYERFMELEPYAANILVEYAMLRAEQMQDMTGAAMLARRALMLPAVPVAVRQEARVLCQPYVCDAAPNGADLPRQLSSQSMVTTVGRARS